MLDQWQKVIFFTPKRQGCTETEQPSLLSVYLDSGYPFSDFLGRRTRAAEVLTYADVWAMDGDGRTGGRSRREVITQSCVLRAGNRGQQDGRHGRRTGQTRTWAAGVGQTLPVPLTKDTCREQVTELMAINNTSDKVSL